jgi:NAD(P)-dependent dehydrogenase (short-subunit alcohol dehydrogenase family)
MPEPTLSLQSLFGLDGRVALVPGGSGDIGAALARGLAAAGARVAICARDGARAEAFAAELRAAGHDAIGLSMDAHRVDDIRRAVDAVADHYGALDLLLNCVGIQREERLLEVTEDAFDELLQVNLKGAMFLAQAVARHQVAGVQAGRAPGRQLHVLSVRALLGMRDRGYSAYCATKGALVTLIRQHAVELSAWGVTVNGLAPTVVRGRMGAHWLANPETRDAILRRIPLGRVAEPDDLVAAALFFCGPGASFVSGQVLYADGGLTATQ